MGGYAFHVWSSFGLTALVVLIETLSLRAQRKATLRNLRNERLSEASSS
ncbi:MAG: heme exporter protein CcmD [Betaproteobacteria bacterium]